MKTPLPDYLARLLAQCDSAGGGQLADYIPELAQADPSKIAIAICTTDGVVYAAGDTDYEFTIQSISKPFAYALALRERGLDEVLRKVGVEPSGEAFNELSLDERTDRPLNPMINAGAITTHALLPGTPGAGRAQALQELLERMVGRSLQVDESVYQSELDTAFRNLSLAYMLRNVGAVQGDVTEIVAGYTRQCAIKVNVQDLARMAGILANQGRCPRTREQLFDRKLVRQMLSVMTSCGMYNGAGDWLSRVGIPAKSGVAGGILGALPGQFGVAVFSPKLDEAGNSVRGVRMMERLSGDMGLHVMEALPTARASLRNPQVQVRADIDLYELQGDIHFAQGELLLRNLQERGARLGPVILDVSRVIELNTIGEHLLVDAVANMQQEGVWVGLVDPGQLLQRGIEVKSLRVNTFSQLQAAIEAACRQ